MDCISRQISIVEIKMSLSATSNKSGNSDQAILTKAEPPVYIYPEKSCWFFLHDPSMTWAICTPYEIWWPNKPCGVLAIDLTLTQIGREDNPLTSDTKWTQKLNGVTVKVFQAFVLKGQPTQSNAKTKLSPIWLALAWFDGMVLPCDVNWDAHTMLHVGLFPSVRLLAASITCRCRQTMRKRKMLFSQGVVSMSGAQVFWMGNH